MSSGKEFDRRIEMGIDSLQAQIASATSIYDRAIEQESRLRQEVAMCYRAIAQLHANALDDGDLQAYDAILARCQVSLRERQARRDTLASTLSPLEEAASVATQARISAQEVYDAHLIEMDHFYRACDSRLVASPAHQALVTTRQQAMELSQAAMTRTAAAEEERQEKACAYDADPIFTYLHGIGYGTAIYAPNLIVRTFDGWLARLCRYSEAAVNYRALCELPLYLSRQAKRLERQFEIAADAVARSLSAERKSSGEHQKSVAGAALKLALERAQAVATSARARVSEVKGALADIELWQDEHGEAILAVLATAIGDEQIDLLEERVYRTAGSDDDAQLQRILRMRDDIERVQEACEEQMGHITELQARLAGLRSVRDRYRSSNFHSSNYRVAGDSNDLLAGMIAGTISHDILWSRVQSQARYEPPAPPPSKSNDGFGGGNSFSSGGDIGGGTSSFSSGGEF